MTFLPPSPPQMERRSSLPTPGNPSTLPSSSALTAEELDIDASIPTYDDVRRFDDSDDGLTSSDSSDEEIGGVTAGPPWRLRYARTQMLQDEETVETTREDEEVEGGGEEGVWGQREEREREGVSTGEKRSGGGEMDAEGSEKRLKTDERVEIEGEEKVASDADTAGSEEKDANTPSSDERVENQERAGSDGESGDSREEGELGMDEAGGVLERPHRPPPGADAPVVCDGERETAQDGVSDAGAVGESAVELMETKTAKVETKAAEAEAETKAGPIKATEAETTAAKATVIAIETGNIETEEVDGIIFDRLERPMRPAPGEHPPLDDLEDASESPEGASCPEEGATGRVEGAIAPEESRWSPDAPTAGAEGAFLDDDAPWSAADSLALRERLQLLNEEYEEDCGRPERTERLRRLNEEWGVPQPGEEPVRYTPDWEPDDDEDGLSSTSGEFVWQVSE